MAVYFSDVNKTYRRAWNCWATDEGKTKDSRLNRFVGHCRNILNQSPSGSDLELVEDWIDQLDSGSQDFDGLIAALLVPIE